MYVEPLVALAELGAPAPVVPALVLVPDVLGVEVPELEADEELPEPIFAFVRTQAPPADELAEPAAVAPDVPTAPPI
jgi:hypothetical protein